MEEMDEDEYTDDEDCEDCTSLDDDSYGSVNNSNLLAEQIAAVNERYLNQVTNLLRARSEVSCVNALSLNKEMQSQLLQMQNRIRTLIQNVKELCANNEKLLKQSMSMMKYKGIGMRGAYLKGGTFYFKGNMFFKDLKCRSCPNNPDYEHRKYVDGEIFPMDFELCARHVWSLVDKMSIVQAVKEQVIDYLANQNDKKIFQFSIENIRNKVSVHSEKLVKLMEKVDENFSIDWLQISAHNLRYRHSPTSCKTMWNVYLHPSLRRSEWSREENELLLEVVKKHNFQDWVEIASAMDRRSDYQCFIQYHTTVCYMLPQRWSKWDKRDDSKLLELIEKNTVNGVINWNIVGAHFPHKPRKTIQHHYIYSLNPQISHAPFTAEEDLIILAAVEEYGNKFSCFPRTLFPNRSITQLRVRYVNTLRNRHKLTSWSVEDDKKLMEFVTANGTSSWQLCAQTLDTHTRMSCRTRYLTIQKFLAKNKNAKLENLPRKKKLYMKNSIITAENWIEKITELRDNPNANFKPQRTYNRNKKMVEKKEKKKLNQRKKNTGKRLKVETDNFLKQRCKMGVVKLGQAINDRVKRNKIEHRLDRRYPVYMHRLRAVGIQMYHFFKYSFNFILGRDSCTLCPNSCYSLCLVANALDFQLPMNKPYVNDYTMPAPVRRKVKKFLERQAQIQSFGYRLTPSWSLAMGFRALCIQSSSMNTESPTVIKNNESIERFRIRIRALFYNTSLLSRLNPNNFEKIHNLEIFDNTETVCSDINQFSPQKEDINLKKEPQTESNDSKNYNRSNESETSAVNESEKSSIQSEDRIVAALQLEELKRKHGRKRKRLSEEESQLERGEGFSEHQQIEEKKRMENNSTSNDELFLAHDIKIEK